MAMRDLDRSLAFTALLELSKEFREMEQGAGSALITHFLECYYSWLDLSTGFVHGKHDIFTYARQWLREGNISKTP